MLRLLLLHALGLLLHGPAAARGAPADATAFVQRQARAWARGAEAPAREAQTPEGGPQKAESLGYAFERYKVGEVIEGRGRDGRWVPVIVTGRAPGSNRWNINVADEYPGLDLPGVPTEFLRRPLGPGMSDYYVDNSWLKHEGLGVKYRHTKNMHNKSAEYAPWGSLVVGTDEGNGWLRLADGYLPMDINGVPVLKKMPRSGKPTPLPLDFRLAAERQQQSLMPKDPTPPPLHLEVGEWVNFRSKRGWWYPAQVTAPTNLPNKYHITVRLNDGYTVFPVQYVDSSRLRKRTVEKPTPDPHDSPLCQKGECVRLHVRTNSSGKELSISISKRLKTEMLMRMVCNKLGLRDWEACQQRCTFKKDGRDLSRSAHIHEAGLQDHDVVDVTLAGPSMVDSLLDDKLPTPGSGMPEVMQRETEPKHDSLEELLRNIM